MWLLGEYAPALAPVRECGPEQIAHPYQVTVGNTRQLGLNIQHNWVFSPPLIATRRKELGWVYIKRVGDPFNGWKPCAAGPVFDPHDHCRRQLRSFCQLTLRHASTLPVSGDQFPKTLSQIHCWPSTIHLGVVMGGGGAQLIHISQYCENTGKRRYLG